MTYIFYFLFLVSAITFWIYHIFIYILFGIPILIGVIIWDIYTTIRFNRENPLIDYGKWGKHRNYTEYMEYRMKLGHGRWNADEYSPQFFEKIRNKYENE